MNTKKGNIWSNKQTNKECLEYGVITNFSTVKKKKKDLDKKKRERMSKNWSNKVKKNF